MSHKAAIEAALMLSPRSRLIQQDGRTRLLIEMFPYSTAVLADNENFRLTVSVTATSPLIEAHDAVRPEVGTSCPTSLVAPYHPTAPAPTMAGAPKLFATTIDIRDMTKGKLSEAHCWPEAFDFRCGRAALSHRNRNAWLLDELRHHIDDLGQPANESHALAELFHAVTSIPRSQSHAVDYCQQGRAILEHRSRLNRSRFHEPKLRSRTGIGAFVADHFRRGDIGLRRGQMNKYDSRRAIHKTIVIVAASLALGTATVTTATGAFARGGGAFGGHFGGGGGFGGHFGGGGFGGHFGAGFGHHFGGRFGDHFGGARFADRDFGRRFGDRFGLYGFGDLGPYYGGYDGCYVFTPYAYSWACY